MSFSTSWLRHEGHSHTGDEFSTRISNSFPHAEQRYSKIGIHLRVDSQRNHISRP